MVFAAHRLAFILRTYRCWTHYLIPTCSLQKKRVVFGNSVFSAENKGEPLVRLALNLSKMIYPFCQYIKDSKTPCLTKRILLPLFPFLLPPLSPHLTSPYGRT